MQGEGVDEVGGYGHEGREEAETDAAGADDGDDPVNVEVGRPAVQEDCCTSASVCVAGLGGGGEVSGSILTAYRYDESSRYHGW